MSREFRTAQRDKAKKAASASAAASSPTISNSAAQKLLHKATPAATSAVPENGYTTNWLGLPDEATRSAIAKSTCPATEAEIANDDQYQKDSATNPLTKLNNELFHDGDTLYREKPGEGPLSGMGECGYDPSTGALTDSGTLNIYNAAESIGIPHGLVDAIPGWSEQIVDGVSSVSLPELPSIPLPEGHLLQTGMSIRDLPERPAVPNAQPSSPVTFGTQLQTLMALPSFRKR